MGKFRFLIVIIFFTASCVNIAAKNIYPSKIDAGNDVIPGIADLSHCFDKDGQPLFDELYVIGRIWQERQDTNFLTFPNIDRKQLIERDNLSDINPDYVVQDTSQRNLLWYVEPQTRCSAEVRQTYYRVEYHAVTDKFGNTTCEPEYIDSIITDSTKYLYLDYSGTLPDSASYIVAKADTSSCRWTTSQNFVVREYFNYDYISTSYHWTGEPETHNDTTGCVVMRINRQVFNPHLEGSEKTPTGELRYVNGATEWISPTDTAFIAGAVGGGTHIAKMIWQPDTIKDSFYWNPDYPRDTLYTVLRFDVRTKTLTQALSEHNSEYSTQATVTHTDALKYTRTDNGYELSSRWDAKKQGFPEFKTIGKKLYFTGRLVPASIISTNAENKEVRSTFSGAVSGNNDGPAAVFIHNRGINDLYLENFQLGTQSLGIDADEPTSMFDKMPRKYISAAITLEGNGQDTYIHFRGSNYLCGNIGRPTISTLHSAAIYMNVGTNDFLSLTFDDIWADGIHTNGLLKMEGSADEQIGNVSSTYHRTASPIYSGNRHTSVTFNGGNYHLAPADNTTSTGNFMIVSRRAYKSPINNYVFPDVGSDVGDGLVYIRDGNFRMSTPLLSNPRTTPMMLADGTQYSHEYYVMYFPTRTYITGGTFENCLVRTTDGDATAPDCNGIIQCPTNGQQDLFCYYLPCDTSGNITRVTNLNNTDADTTGYDFSRLQPQFDSIENRLYVMPYLPSSSGKSCDEDFDSNCQNWDILFPQGISSDILSDDRPLIVTQKRSRGENIEGTNYLAMCEINPYYPNELNLTPSNLTETGEYTINKAVYLITWTMADKWRIKTMPFDVSRVTLALTWATDSLRNTPDPDLEFDYYKKTFQTIILKGRLSEIEKERGMNLPFWSLYQRAVTGSEPDPEKTQQPSQNYFPTVAREPQQLYYFGQADSLPPSFYLLEAQTIPLPDGAFCRSWTIPQPDSAGIIMHKGHTYAIMFPNTDTPQTDGYDFWNGKYIVFEGTGQTLSGIQNNDPEPEDNNILITGNSTFRTFYNNPFTRYDWNYYNQRFERCAYTAVGWSEPYILASDNAWHNNSIFDIQCITDTTPNAINYALSDENIQYQVIDHTLYITTTEPQTIAVFSIDGKLLSTLNTQHSTPNSQHSTFNTQLSLPTGIYIVIASKNAHIQKIII